MGRMENKVVLVYGGASGMAKAACKIIANEGAKVVVTDVNLEGAKAVADEIVAAGGEASALSCNALNFDEIKAALDFTVEKYGALNGVIFQPGIDIPASIAQIEQDKWDLQVALNLTAPMYAIRYCAGYMAENGGGSIVVTSSFNSHINCEGFSAYCATKGGVDQFCRVAAMEYGRYGVRVNTINPGFIRTAMTDVIAYDDVLQVVKDAQCVKDRIGIPEDFGYLALFLLSDESHFITAVNIDMDGGLHTAGYPDINTPMAKHYNA